MTLSAINLYIREVSPEIIGLGSAAYITGHLVSYIINGATPHAFGTAVTIGWTVATIARKVFEKKDDERIYALLAGVVSGFWLTNRLFYPLTFAELLKTTGVAGAVIITLYYLESKNRFQKPKDKAL
jgi:hypothetical protein